MTHQHGTIGDTIYFWFGSNNTSGSGADGASPAADVRLAGDTAGAAPILSPTPTLLTHVNYPDGCHEVAVAATVGNGFAAGNTYAVFCTLLVDSQNPTGFVGSFALTPIVANVKQVSDDATAADNLELDYDGTGYNKSLSAIGTATALGANAVDATSLATAAAQKIADELLSRGVANVEDTADATSLAALVLAAFESVISGATWTIYKTDHATTFTTRTVTTDAGADPIVEVT